MTRRIVLVLATMASTAAFANVVWRGDFNTGDRSQWSGTEMVSPDRLQIVSSPVWDGSYALKATVVQGDNPINASGNRNEIYRNTFEPSGSEYYYRWAVYFPSSFPYTTADMWHLFTQWHGTGCCGAPPLSFAVADDKFNLTLFSTNIWRSSQTEFSRGQWHEFILHAKWSSDPSVGFLELWHNGQLVMPKRYGANQNPGEVNYLKMGLYRPVEIQPTTTIYLDGMVMGTTMADVTGGVTPTDAGTSGTGTGTVDAGTSGGGTSGGGTGTVDAGTPSGGTSGGGTSTGGGTVDAGTTTGGGSVDAGTPTGPDQGGATVDAGTPADEQHPSTVNATPDSAQTATGIPGTSGTDTSGEQPVPGSDSVGDAQPVHGGCNFVPLSTPFAVIALAGLSRLRRRRRD